MNCGDFFRLAVAVRYSLLVPAVIALLAVFGYLRGNKILDAVFLCNVAKPWQLINLTIVSLIAVAFSFVVVRVTLLNAADRLPDVSWRFSPHIGGIERTFWILAWLTFGLAVPLIALRATVLGDENRFSLSDPIWSHGLRCIGLGTAIAAIALTLSSVASRSLLGPDDVEAMLTPFDELAAQTGIRWSGQWTSPLLASAGPVPGYIRTTVDGRLALGYGHGQALLNVVLVLSAYFIIWRAAAVPETAPFSVAFYLLLIVLLFSLTLGAIAFFLDRYRIPLPLVFVLLIIVSAQLYLSDHFYELLPKQAEAPPPPKLEDVMDGWANRREAPRFPKGKDDKRTLVLVAAAGGGIQASAWTAQVLAGLHERYGARFSRSVGAISSVSGGSVASLFYLRKHADLLSDDPRKSKEAVEWIRRASRSSAMEAVGWGFAFPDLARVLAPWAALAPSPLEDRGLAVERVWRRKLAEVDGGSEWLLSDLRDPVAKGDLPLPIFNTTIVDSGQRFLFSPVDLGLDPDFATDADEFSRVYPQSDVLVSTAVRLSATFSYIAPICRPMRGHDRFRSRWIADGGYADNEGIVSCLKMIDRLLKHYEGKKDRPFDRILVLRILGFPEPRATTVEPETQFNKNWSEELKAAWNGLQQTVAGPIALLNTVRSSSQSERGQLEMFQVESDAQVRASHFYVASALAALAAKPGAPAEAPNAAAFFAAAPGQSQAAANAIELRREYQKGWSPQIERVQNAVKRKAVKRKPAAPGVAPIAVSSVKFVYDTDALLPADTHEVIPLSWMLSPFQQLCIDRAWERLLTGKTVDGREYRYSPFGRKLFIDTDAGNDATLILDDVFGK